MGSAAFATWVEITVSTDTSFIAGYAGHSTPGATVGQLHYSTIAAVATHPHSLIRVMHTGCCPHTIAHTSFAPLGSEACRSHLHMPICHPEVSPDRC
jgi:hypothetical protein